MAPSPSILERLAADGKPAPRLRLQDVSREPELAITDVGLRQSGRYEVLGEIARGGVGQIFKGRDVDLGCDVALKVLRDRHLEDPDLLRRFVEEAQIGGQLQHPGIVPVYELGLQVDRRPFFAMKLVKGRTLTALLAERKRPSRDLRRFLTVFEQICRTVAYAHARGVIHRYLKPSNVMVGAFGEVQILDWGFAKVLAQGGVADERRAKQAEREVTLIATVRSEEGSQSIPGSVMGTPAYMPPEQALGHVEALDERSDVFSLGAILCEILTGKPPYTAESGNDRLIQAAHARLDDAHARLASCGADAAIVRLAKACLEPLRQDRPANAGEAADTVTAHLAAVEERAHRSELRAAEARTRAKEAREEAAEQRRSRRQTRILAAAILLTILVGGGAFLWIDRDARARSREVARAVNKAVREATLHRGRDETETAFVAANRAAELARAGDAPADLRDRVAGLVAELEAETARARAVAARRAHDDALVDRLEAIRLGTADHRDVVVTDRLYETTFREVGLDAERLAASHRRVDLADALDDWALLRRYEEELAERPWRDLVAIARHLDPDGDELRDAILEGNRERLLALAADDEIASMSARDLHRLAAGLGHIGEADAEIDLLDRARLRHPDDFWLAHTLGKRLTKTTPTRPREALPHLHAALALRPECPWVWHRLGHARQDLGKLDEALDAFGRAVRLDGSEPFHHGCLGSCLGAAGRHPEAIASEHEAIRLDPEFAGHHYNLGAAFALAERWEEAARAYRQAIELDPERAACHHGLGLALQRLPGRMADALTAFRDALRLDRDHPTHHFSLGFALWQEREFEAAHKSYTRARELDPTNADYAISVGIYHCDVSNEPEKAERIFREAVELDPENAHARDCLGVALQKQGRREEALVAWRKALEVDPRGDRALGSRLRIANNLHDWGREEEARDGYRAALRLVEEGVEIAAWKDIAQVRTELGVAHMRLRHWDEATAAFREAMRDPAFRDEALRGLHNVGIGILHAADRPPSEAEEILREVADAWPNATTWEALGTARTKQGDTAGAAEAYAKAVECDPANAQYRDELAVALAKLGRDQEAMRHFRKAVRLAPVDPRSHWNLATHLWNTGRREEAEKPYRTAVRLAPDHAPYLRTFGEYLREMGQTDEAITVYRKAADLEPGHAGTWAELGRLFGRVRRLKKAVASVRKAIELDPQNADHRSDLGIYLGWQERWKEAKTALRDAIALSPKNGTIHKNLGAVYLGMGLLEDAEASVRLALELAPEVAGGHSLLGQILERLGRLSEAARAFGTAAFRDPENAEHHRALGRVLALDGRPRPAEMAMRKACELEPENAGLLQDLGAVLEFRGRFDEAETALRRALELDQDRWRIHAWLGDLHLTQGRPDEAVERLFASARLADDDPLAYSLLARALVATGRFAQARTVVQKAVGLGPKTEHDVVWTETLAWSLERMRTADVTPRTPEDRLALAAHSIASSRGATRAAREFEAAFAAEPRLAGEMHWRLLAARAAATVGCGMAVDGKTLDEAERARWRSRALGWLHEELERRSEEPRLVRIWLLAPAYAGVREEALLEKLPEPERQAWRAFWAEVREVLEKAEREAR